MHGGCTARVGVGAGRAVVQSSVLHVYGYGKTQGYERGDPSEGDRSDHQDAPEHVPSVR
jgi:hypothetical protein